MLSRWQHCDNFRSPQASDMLHSVKELVLTKENHKSAFSAAVTWPHLVTRIEACPSLVDF